MDNFTLAVVIGDIAMLVIFVLLAAFDGKGNSETTEPQKAAGKRPA